MGMATMTNLMTMLVSTKVKPNDPISKAIAKQFRKVTPETNLGLVSRILEKDSFVLVVQDQEQGKSYRISNNLHFINIFIF